MIDTKTILCLYGSKLVLLTFLPAEDVVPKTMITVATTANVQLLQSIAVRFNQQSDQYRVVIKDYSTETDPETAVYGDVKFNTDLMAGMTYDLIYFTGGIDTTPYVRQGVLMDLYEVFEKDDDLSKDNLLGLLRGKFERDGRLYTLPVVYFLTTLIGKEATIGSGETLSVEELLRTAETLPADQSLFTCGRAEVLDYYLKAGANDYIDDDKAACHFENETFTAMLKLIKSLPQTASGTPFYRLSEAEKIGTLKTGDAYYRDFLVLSVYDLLSLSYYYGEEAYVIKGFPTESGNGSIIDRFNYLSVMKNSSNQAGAAAFLKFWLSDAVQMSQSSAGLPLTVSSLKAMLKAYTDRYYYTNGTELFFYDEPLTEEAKRLYKFDDYTFDAEASEKVLRFFTNTNVSSLQDETVLAIIREEAANYFADASTLEQCVGYIQNRVTTYLNENYS